MPWTIDIIVLQAMPMMADVVSGAMPEPAPPRPDESWWHWAVRSHAGRRALAELGCDVDVAAPWFYTVGGWHCEPWIDPGQDEPWPQFDGVVGQLREVIVAEPSAGVFHLVHRGAGADLEHVFVALNEDGTRAAIGRVSELDNSIVSTSFRLAGPAHRQLQWLSQHYGNQTTAVTVAIDRLYHAERFGS
jgi:hypothetical protein